MIQHLSYREIISVERVNSYVVYVEHINSIEPKYKEIHKIMINLPAFESSQVNL